MVRLQVHKEEQIENEQETGKKNATMKHIMKASATLEFPSTTINKA